MMKMERLEKRKKEERKRGREPKFSKENKKHMWSRKTEVQELGQARNWRKRDKENGNEKGKERKIERERHKKNTKRKQTKE